MDRLHGARVSKATYKEVQNQIYKIIFRVPSVDEISKEEVLKSRASLMNLMAGPDWMQPYTFSTPDIDLAIISLNQRDEEFLKELKSLGYQPVHLSDLSDAPTTEGAEVFIVGYPSFATFPLPLNQFESQWSSVSASVPNYAFGKVSMLNPELPYFWCDMSVFPGFSGSPVIENNKLVGIVSGQKRIPIDRVIKIGEEISIKPDNTLLVRIPFGNNIKAQFIKSLLEVQIKKDLNANPKH